jgi:hypothetical protein
LVVTYALGVFDIADSADLVRCVEFLKAFVLGVVNKVASHEIIMRNLLRKPGNHLRQSQVFCHLQHQALRRSHVLYHQAQIPISALHAVTPVEKESTS